MSNSKSEIFHCRNTSQSDAAIADSNSSQCTLSQSNIPHTLRYANKSFYSHGKVFKMQPTENGFLLKNISFKFEKSDSLVANQVPSISVEVSLFPQKILCQSRKIIIEIIKVVFYSLNKQFKSPTCFTRIFKYSFVKDRDSIICSVLSSNWSFVGG